jgi:DNA-binding beta-propeller fold protein YncE
LEDGTTQDYVVTVEFLPALYIVSTLAGSGTSGSADGTVTAASFYRPRGIAVDSVGNVYVADHYNNLIRKLTPQ